MRGVLLFWIVLMLGGCIARLPPPNPTRSISIGAALLDDTFDTGGVWETYHTDGFLGEIINGSYHLETSLREYGFVLEPDIWGDVVIEAELYLRSSDTRALYGVICRAHSTGEGYYFLISGDGSFSIRRGENRAVTALIPWQDTSAFRKDAPRQRMRAVCHGDYLALYLNDEFVGEATDHFYQEGRVGLVAAVPPNAPEQTQVTLDIDSVRVWEAK